MYNQIIKDDINFIFEELSSLYNLYNLNNSNILITGGTGFFGKSILNFLIFLRHTKKINVNIILLTRNKNNFLINYPQYNQKFINFIEDDIRTFKYNFNNIDYCIHAASSTSKKMEIENPKEIFSIVYDGTYNIIKIANNSNIKRMLFVSTGDVYGKKLCNDKKSYIETDKCSPISYYGKAKKISEEILLESNIDVSIARCFAFVGPYLDLNAHYAVGNFIRDVINNDDIIIKGDGKPLRTYLYMADLVIWLFAILLKSKNKSIYNVGSSKEISIYELANKVANAANNYYGKIKVLNESNYLTSDYYIPNNYKIINELGVKENYTLDNAIKRTLEWNITNGGKYE